MGELLVSGRVDPKYKTQVLSHGISKPWQQHSFLRKHLVESEVQGKTFS